MFSGVVFDDWISPLQGHPEGGRAVFLSVLAGAEN